HVVDGEMPTEEIYAARKESDSFADLLVIFLLACCLVISHTSFLICCFLPGHLDDNFLAFDL
ncbi:hypothetical protein ACJX0J_014189, partial [Zea mays]